MIVPTDTVYGLAADGLRREPVERLYRLKGRSHAQPSGLVLASVEVALELVPELRSAEPVLRELLPGPYTLVLPNPARRFPWLTGGQPEAIGIRVPAVDGAPRVVLDAVGAIAATSANHPGGDDACSIEDIPLELVEECAAVLDGGRLPGIASTVIDLTGPEPVIVREGAVQGSVALARARAASARC